MLDVGTEADLDADDQNTDLFSVGKKVRIDLADMDYKSWLHELEQDAENLELLTELVGDITPEHDTKLQTLLALIREKQAHPINPGNRKIIIFTAFSDTADYLYQNVSPFVLREFGLHTAEITGNVEGRTNLPKLRGDLNTVLTCFSPVSKSRDILMPGSKAEIDVLIATDCISEGQNLQDCDYLVNYDIHWNPVRIIQRFGRIDRIGSKNACIRLVNFWPDMDLDEYINLKSRVETRMKISVMTSTGDDDLHNAEERVTSSTAAHSSSACRRRWWILRKCPAASPSWTWASMNSALICWSTSSTMMMWRPLRGACTRWWAPRRPCPLA